MQGQYPQFVLFGDSLIQFGAELHDGCCFAAALQADTTRRLDLLNRGFSGYNSSQAAKMLPALLDGLGPGPLQYLLVLFGANDAALPDTTGQHVELRQYAANLRSIITHPRIRAQGPRIILCTPPPVNPAQLDRPTRSAEFTKKYADAARQVGEELRSLSVAVCDVWTRISDEAGRSGPEDLLSDGIHLTGRGYTAFYDELIISMRARWPDSRLEDLPSVFPDWKTPDEQ